jgi:hypothetical protein
MGISYNSSIVTSGLVLALDAANPKNYNLTAVEVLVVAGGGGGGTQHGGGGGAGGLIYNSNFAVTPGSVLTVTIGGGGTGSPGGGSFNRPSGGDGEPSVFSTIIAQGGGGGSSISNPVTPGRPGGSGGGCALAGAGSGSTGAGGLGNSPALSPSQGNAGGAYTGYDGSNNYGGGGGGGGASASGEPAPQPNGASWRAGNGGAGRSSSISGASVTYAGGGGGGSHTPFTFGLGGLGGGGNGGLGNNPSPTGDGTIGQANTGGGGGGGGALDAAGGAGGTGIVIVRYPGPQKAIGGTITSNNGYTIHTFITSGNFTPLVATNNSAVLGLSDFSGNNNFGTAVNGPTYSSANGGSLSFVYSNSNCVSIPLSTSLNKTQGTMNFWVYPTRYNGSNGYFVNRDNSTPNAFDWLWIGTYGDVFYFRLGNGSDCCSNDLTFSSVSSVIPLNSWTNMCFTWVSNGTSAIYKNGTLHTSRSIGNVPATNPSVTGRIGLGHGSLGDEFFHGNISNTQIYNRALSAAEISQNFNALRGRFSI